MGTSCYSDKNAILSNQAGRVLTLPGIKVYPHHVLLRTCRIWVSYLKRILYEAESAGCLLDFIQSDDDALDISTFRKQLVDLFNSDKNKKRQKWGLCDCWSQRGLLGHLIRITGHEKMEKQAKKKKKRKEEYNTNYLVSKTMKMILPAPRWCRRRDCQHTKCGSASAASPVHNGFPENTQHNVNKLHFQEAGTLTRDTDQRHWCLCCWREQEMSRFYDGI